uniref:DUF3299 domain-containing protein n=1 Tax=Microbulbifer agarilyticus TaxID=260552 RepID=UPI000255B626|nr:DUF3299 domain-containing protein [Microbulbifer agarilyticus]
MPVRTLYLATMLCLAVLSGCSKADLSASRPPETPDLHGNTDKGPDPDTGDAHSRTTSPATKGVSKAQQDRDDPPYRDIEYRDVAWEELIPQEDLQALLNPPEYLDAIAEGSEGDIFPEGPEGIEQAVADTPYQRALKSARIKPEFDQQNVRIPGFVVPLEFDDDQTITSFLLVPYFGACIHLPPPPPNQVIYGEFSKGFQVQFLFDPFYIEGELRTLPTSTEQGEAAYRLNVHNISPYED